jgi:hypothetical protein
MKIKKVSVREVMGRTFNATKRLTPVAGLVIVGFIVGHTSVSGQAVRDELESGFRNPPDSAKPRVWWHWMNGNITKEGIRLDLEWMKRVGIGGFQNFDASLSTPQVVEKRLIFMTPEWKDAFRYTATLADQLGLEMAIAASPGWSETGGPWVPPAQAMKKFVWSETRVEGGRPFKGALPKPPSTTGPFQNITGAGGLAAILNQENQPRPEYYADSAVVAFRAPDSEVPLTQLQPKVTSSGGQFDVVALTDGEFASVSPLPKAPVGEKAWIQFEFAKPQAIHALTLSVRNIGRNPFGPGRETGQEMEASDDGRQFRGVATLPGSRAPVNTVAFKEVTARFFRVTFRTLLPAQGGGGNFPGGRQQAPSTTYDISELVLHTGARVNRFEEKAAFATLPNLYSVATPEIAAKDAVSKSGIVDLTSKMGPDGTLNWTPPSGQWVVLRFGYSLLGINNHPASPEATGLEVDKLNRSYVKAYLDTYLGLYKDAVGELMGKRGLQYVITDSWEAGAQNWTDEMIAEFAKRRGYDMRRWLPVLTGRVVESAEASDRFLWDFRRTIADMTAEYHYDQTTASLRERGMGRYTESHESGRAMIADGMEVKRSADVPMSAMWTPAPGSVVAPRYEADIRESASVAHIYGQNLVAAESLTARGTAWAWSPETLKPTVDLELASGLNRFVIHTSVHQPVSDKVPGLGLGPFGQWFTRHETWAEQAAPWLTYMARSCYMLQQGKFAADVIYFYGEDSNITALFGDKPPAVPAGYSYDYVNADALVHRLSVSGGRITTPNGMSYRVLALDPNSRYMSLPVLRKIRDLVNTGATIVGSKPVATPSLSDDQNEFRAIADQLWAPGTGAHPYGRGQVYGSQTLAEALTALQVGVDFEYTRPQNDTKLLFVHRTLPDGEVYWVNNRNNRAEALEATFRVQGKAAELWYPETGKTDPAGYHIANGRTTVPLQLSPNEAVFVVFRKPATTQSRTLPRQVEAPIAALDGAWDVGFQLDRGAPAKITLDKLISWSESADPGVKYFSGTGTYTRSVNAPSEWFKRGARLWLDLGDVKNLAQVVVNGKQLGIVWKTPFRVDVTDVMKPGVNAVEVKVTNLWVNRLIGDQQPNVTRKHTYTTMPFYRADSPLLPSGLLGPVQLVRVAAE